MQAMGKLNWTKDASLQANDCTKREWGLIEGFYEEEPGNVPQISEDLRSVWLFIHRESEPAFDI